GLEQVVLKEIDQAFGQGAEQLNWHTAAQGPYCGAETSRRQQNHGRRNPGEDDTETDQHQQTQAQRRHDHGCSVPTGRNRPIVLSIRISSAKISSASLMMK